MGMDPKAKSVSMSFREEYVEQLKTKAWHQKRKEVLEHYGNKCAITGKAENLQIHHFEESYQYGKKAWEYSIEDLIPLCEEEHRKMHDLYRKCEGFKVPEGVVCDLIWDSWKSLCSTCYNRKKTYQEAYSRLMKFIDTCKEDGEISHDEEKLIIKKASNIDQETVDEAEVIIKNFNASQHKNTSARDQLEKENEIIKATSEANKKKKKVFGISAIILLVVAVIVFDNFNSTDIDKTPYTENFRIETASQFIGKNIASTAIVYEVSNVKGNTFINLGGRFPDHDMSLTIFYSNKN